MNAKTSLLWLNFRAIINDHDFLLSNDVKCVGVYELKGEQRHLSGAGLFSCAKDRMGEKLVGEGPKTKLAESQFVKRINCHSIKMN